MQLKSTIAVVMFTASGLLVRFLKVFEKSGYQSVKWVRYLSKANGTYQIRVSSTYLVADNVDHCASFDAILLCLFLL